MRKTMLMILDGWGSGDNSRADVIASANTPNMDKLWENYPHNYLNTSGEAVGLPDGQMGNSEVGHLNIGAGRVVYQDMVKINRAIKNGELEKNTELLRAYQYAKDQGKKVHYIGLLGNGGVHALDSHLVALCRIATKMGLENQFLHILTDGRDTDPQSGLAFSKNLLHEISGMPVRIASLIGRYYAMDRDKNWNRIKLAYDLLREGKGTKSQDLLEAIQASYDEGVTDEFIKPVVFVDQQGNPLATIEEGDVVICYNFRTDRLRQMTIAFTQEDLPHEKMSTMPLKWYTMTRYNAQFKGIPVLFDKETIADTLGEYLSKKGLTQLRTAETEKYAHVTFFFSGGVEQEFKGEKRILVNSPKVATYDLKPEMSAYEVTDKVLPEIENKAFDFICLNFANGDMVGHTGVYEAIKKAIQTVDECVGKIANACLKNDYDLLITADHGNADKALNADNSPNTAHTTNPVPCILVSNKGGRQLKEGKLADLAPTILECMGLDIPPAMTGDSLLQ